MSTSNHQPAPAAPTASPNDLGSGVYAACVSRFEPHGCLVTCDERHTVWVKRADGARSVGVSPWQVKRRSMSAILEGVESRLGLAEARQ